MSKKKGKGKVGFPEFLHQFLFVDDDDDDDNVVVYLLAAVADDDDVDVHFIIESIQL